MKKIGLLFTHLVAVGLGFAAGVYFLPILTAPPAPTDAEVREAETRARYTGEFRRDLADSDALHWGEGQVFVADDAITLDGRIAPGPAYRLYLSPQFVETEAEFLQTRARMTPIGEVRTFENFVVPVPPEVRVEDFNTVVIWCESFDQFITAARYR